MLLEAEVPTEITYSPTEVLPSPYTVSVVHEIEKLSL